MKRIGMLANPNRPDDPSKIAVSSVDSIATFA
jgi:hypothetical protein